eukprot:6181055-Pleurochrysis_carterae.AAC.1
MVSRVSGRASEAGSASKMGGRAHLKGSEEKGSMVAGARLSRARLACGDDWLWRHEVRARVLDGAPKRTQARPSVRRAECADTRDVLGSKYVRRAESAKTDAPKTVCLMKRAAHVRAMKRDSGSAQGATNR